MVELGIRPELTRQITLADFRSHYWLKTELVKFCNANELATVGSKRELVERIEAFITAGDKIKPEIAKQATRDSYLPIKTDTPVENYNNDLVTRQFFIQHIGHHFHFNAYLRQFKNKNNIKPGLTYGDLVKGWMAEESNRKKPEYKTNIDAQFEYNQFVRDFFSNEMGKSHADAVKAWKMVKLLPGAKTYSNYKSTLRREDDEKRND